MVMGLEVPEGEYDVVVPGCGSAVILADGRVTLRPWETDDAGFMAHASADPDISRYNGRHDRRGFPEPQLTVVAASAVIDGFAAIWQNFAATGDPTGVAFAVVDDGSGALVGCCGVDGWSDTDVAQFGYWLAPQARGRGCATRAATLMTQWLFGLGAARVFVTIVAANDASAAVARRAGFVYEGTMRAHGVWRGQRCDVMLFAALPTEWEGRPGSH